MNICGKAVMVEGWVVRVARIAAEGFEFLEDPEAAVASLRELRTGIDLFTFMPKLPHTSPEYTYSMEWDNVAALPVSTFENWWTRQIDGKTRNMVRRAEKKGVVVCEVLFDEKLVKGIWEIYNECPIRQGRPFPHYGKDVDTVHKMSATFPETSFFIGAFVGEKLVGFMKLTSDDARSQAAVMHIIALVEERDRAPTNALIAQAVQSCANRGIPYIVYSKFAYGAKQRDSLSDFKESNGFQRIDQPRYYVPLTRIGAMAFRLGLHHSLLGYVPDPILTKLRELRNAWYRRKVQSLATHA
jgi:hypothetical protein